MSNIVLTDKLSQRVREMVVDSPYESESELIAASLEMLQQQQDEIEAWIVEKVIPACDAWKADPSRATPMEEAFRRIRQRIDQEHGRNGNP